MNKYFLNFLRWITKGQMPDEILKTAYGFKIKGNKFSFKFKAKIDTKNWRFYTGSVRRQNGKEKV